jgi:hypothetical protein
MRRLQTTSALLALLLLGVPAIAAPTFRLRNAQSVHVRLGDKREAGFAIKQAGGEWRLELGRVDAELAEIVDVTSGAASLKWQVEVVGGALRMEEARFIAGHAYRVELRRGPKTLGSALVYLTPPKALAQRAVSFDEGETPGDGEMATLPKPTL